MGKGLSDPRMPPLLFPDASRDDPQKRSSRFSLYFHIDVFPSPIFPAPLRFPFIDNLHHTSYFVNQRIKSDVQRNSFRAASPPAKKFRGMRGGGSGEGRRSPFSKGPFSPPPAHHSHPSTKKGKNHVRLPDHLPRACRRKPHTHPHGLERPPALRVPSHGLSGSGPVHNLEAPVDPAAGPPHRKQQTGPLGLLSACGRLPAPQHQGSLGMDEGFPRQRSGHHRG